MCVCINNNKCKRPETDRRTEQLKSLSRHTIFPDPFNPDQNPNPEMKRISETMENETKIHEKLGNLFYYNLMLYSVVH